jgi:hypothetical protein
VFVYLIVPARSSRPTCRTTVCNRVCTNIPTIAATLVPSPEYHIGASVWHAELRYSRVRTLHMCYASMLPTNAYQRCPCGSCTSIALTMMWTSYNTPQSNVVPQQVVRPSYHGNHCPIRMIGSTQQTPRVRMFSIQCRHRCKPSISMWPWQ